MDKTVKTLGIIMGAFIICWLPFFLAYLISPFCNGCIPRKLYASFTWLGYLNSLLNPLIYIVCKPQFRTTFKDILLCRYFRSKSLKKTAGSRCPGIDDNRFRMSLKDTFSPQLNKRPLLKTATSSGRNSSSKSSKSSHKSKHSVMGNHQQTMTPAIEVSRDQPASRSPTISGRSSPAFVSSTEFVTVAVTDATAGLLTPSLPSSPGLTRTLNSTGNTSPNLETDQSSNCLLVPIHHSSRPGKRLSCNSNSGESDAGLKEYGGLASSPEKGRNSSLTVTVETHERSGVNAERKERPDGVPGMRYLQELEYLHSLHETDILSNATSLESSQQSIVIRASSEEERETPNGEKNATTAVCPTGLFDRRARNGNVQHRMARDLQREQETLTRLIAIINSVYESRDLRNNARTHLIGGKTTATEVSTEGCSPGDALKSRSRSATSLFSPTRPLLAAASRSEDEEETAGEEENTFERNSSLRGKRAFSMTSIGFASAFRCRPAALTNNSCRLDNLIDVQQTRKIGNDLDSSTRAEKGTNFDQITADNLKNLVDCEATDI